MLRRRKQTAAAAAAEAEPAGQSQQHSDTFAELLATLEGGRSTFRERQKAAHALSTALAEEGKRSAALEAGLKYYEARSPCDALVSLADEGGTADGLTMSLVLAALTNLGKQNLLLVNNREVGALVARCLMIAGRKTADDDAADSTAALRGFALAAGFNLSRSNLVAAQVACAPSLVELLSELGAGDTCTEEEVRRCFLLDS